MIWRWDQGRSQYFKFDAIRKISSVLLKYNGADMQTVDFSFRNDLMETVELPFAPGKYTIKRNYKRVFECAQLATYIGNRLIISDIGRALATGDYRLKTEDGYLCEVESRFRYPYPAFNNYGDVKNVCFPFIALQKFLFAKALREGKSNVSITLEEIGAYLIANEVSGLEDLDFYWDLSSKSFSFDSYSSSDQKRQVREMMAFIGQHSYLEYEKGELFLIGVNLDSCEKAFENLQPIDTEITSKNPVDDFIKLTSYHSLPNPSNKVVGESEDDQSLAEFSVVEGKRVFTQHFARERDNSLRKAYIKAHPQPICDVCGRDMHIVYPWTENILEVHHIMPLSSGNDDANHTTKLEDVVGICPSCHRAIHIYYKNYLLEKRKEDFSNKDEAVSVYKQAKSEVKA